MMYRLQEIVDRAYRRAKDLVQSNISVLHACSDLLMEREQIDGEDLQALLVEAQSEQYLKSDEPSVSIPYRTAA
jgi:cell division protease FtsH